jgi:hypothetical protein
MGAMNRLSVNLGSFALKKTGECDCGFLSPMGGRLSPPLSPLVGGGKSVSQAGHSSRSSPPYSFSPGAGDLHLCRQNAGTQSKAQIVSRNLHQRQTLPYPVFAIAVKGWKLIWSAEGVRSFPFIVAFFVIFGFRSIFQFPADLASNWSFE